MGTRKDVLCVTSDSKSTKILWRKLDLYGRLGAGTLCAGVQIWPISTHSNYSLGYSLRISHRCTARIHSSLQQSGL